VATTVTEEFHNGDSRKRVVMTAAETSPWFFVSDASVVAVPSAGASMSVDLTHSQPSRVRDGLAVVIEWPAGEVTETTSARMQNATAIRFRSIGGPGVGEIAE